MKVLVTGSEGLIGSALCSLLESCGHQAVRLDTRLAEGAVFRGDVRDRTLVRNAVSGCSGVVHLAAVSRVIWGEQNPALCRSVNEGGTETVLDEAVSRAGAWMMYASSREVYGECLPGLTPEDAPRLPINVYGVTKVTGELKMAVARSKGGRTSVVRFSNVYGTTSDHADRVTPAFTRAAAEGRELRLDGPDHVFDFTYVHDVVKGVLLAVEALEAGESELPDIHFVTGHGTDMRTVAELAVASGAPGARIVEGVPRNYDVAHFVGDPARAMAVLGWKAERLVDWGVPKLVSAFKAIANPA
ncbi:MAG: NAD-dependent epimerase/dehydratase family protein [bacterium]